MNISLKKVIEKWREECLDTDISVTNREEIISFLLLDLVEMAKAQGFTEDDLKKEIGDDTRHWVYEQYRAQ